MGPVVHGAYTAWRSRLTDRHQTRIVTSVGLNYPAAAVSKILSDKRAYFRGLDTGVDAVVDLIVEGSTDCPQQRYVLAGYSQGAMVMHRALWRLSHKRVDLSRIDGAMLLADGDRHAKAGGALSYGTAENGKGIAWLLPSIAGDTYHPQRGFPSLGRRVHSVCLDYDLVCDANLAHLKFPATVGTNGALKHLKYRPGKSGYTYVEKAAATVARATSSHKPTVAPYPPKIATGVLGRATVGAPYDQRLHTEDDRPGTWTVDASRLPPGLMLSRDRIRGIPTTAGVGRFRIRFTDGQARSTTRTYNLTVSEPGQAAPAGGSLAVGMRHACLLRVDGTIWCWGRNADGQLGDGTTIDRNTPVRVGAYTDWTSVAAGNDHTCGLRAGGTAWCWGRNDTGQIGDDARGTDRTSPVQVGIWSDWTSLVGGGAHTCGIRAGGTSWCWGANRWGQLGNRTTEDRNLPTQAEWTDWESLTAGFGHTCGIRANRSAWCWGDGLHGRLGDGNTQVGWINPKPVAAPANWDVLRAGDLHTCGLDLNGDAWCWGHGGFGELGVVETVDRRSPVKVQADDTWTTLVSRSFFTCGITLSLGAVRCWGWQPYAETVGDMTFMGNLLQDTPTTIGSRTGWTGIGVGSDFGCALRADETAWCWGVNAYGQLGDGTTTPRREFVQVQI